jgi:PadR family transcriptional regulator PadR
MPGGRRRRRGSRGGGTLARRTKSFVQSSLLLLLQRGESHGYALMEGLKQSGLADDSLNASVVYRGLREMEESEWVTSRWDPQESGPSRRVYRITPQGEEYLENWAGELGEMRNTLDRFLEAYHKGSGQRGRT